METPGTDRKLAELPADQCEQLIAWLLDEGLTCPQAQERLREKYHVQTEAVAVYQFYLDQCVPRRLRRAARAADGLPERAGVALANWDPGSVALIKQRYFELLAAPAADPKDLALFATQVVNVERTQINREKLRLQWETSHEKFKFQRRQALAELRLKRQALALSKWKFQTKAADLALRFAKEIKTIAADRTLAADAKIEQVRQRLFGSAPAKPKEERE